MSPKRTILRDLRDDVRFAVRFWSKVAIGEPLSCWEWTASRGSNLPGHNYGKIGVDGGNRFAHRVSWILANGPIPIGMDVLHHCDNPPCVNPSHLYLGTHTDNMRDRSVRGRFPSTAGSLHPEAILTEQAVMDIRERRRNGDHRVQATAAEYGISVSTYWAVVLYRSWKHVP